MKSMKPALAPVYHRQRLLLFLLEAAGGRLSKMDLQKLLFLYMQDSDAGHYAFLPYRFGCYSFRANDDLQLMYKRGWLNEDDNFWVLNTQFMEGPWVWKSEERRRVLRWITKYPMRGRALVREVYRRYPYYATRSEMKEGVLTAEELERIEALRPTHSKKNSLFTIGYEGIEFESYVNKLLRNDVRILCDVRRNPLSRKFGFSKHTLSTLLPKLGIDYLHIPELGIPSEYRQNLQEEGARDRLFQEYAAVLPDQDAALAQVLKLVEQYNSVALTCFEARACECHRHCIADYLKSKCGIGVEHL